MSDPSQGATEPLRDPAHASSSDRLALTAELIAAMPRPGSREAFFERLLGAVFSTLDVQRAFVDLRDERGRIQRVASRNEEPGHEGEPIGASRTILDRALSQGVGQLLVDAGSDEAVGEAQSVHDLQLRSVLCAPILLRDEVKGVLCADNRVEIVSFTRDDLQFLELLGRLAGVALETLGLHERLESENRRLRASLREGVDFLSSSPAMEPVLRTLRLAARADASVLVTGESGVGKEVAARSLHALSDRKDGPLVAVNCAAIPEPLLEAELFGLAARSGVAGAPPEGRPGRFEQAEGGTLFLDEIGDMASGTQARILRALENRTIDRIGATAPVPVNIRVVAATNKDLDSEVSAGRFREDLLFRLRVLEIHVPPLRERREDVLPLAELFMGQLAADSLRFDSEATAALEAHSWPGNVRELRNAVERAVTLCEGRVVRPEHLPPQVRSTASGGGEATGLPSLEEVEHRHVEAVLHAAGGKVKLAAEILGLSRNTLYARMRRWGLPFPRSRD